MVLVQYPILYHLSYHLKIKRLIYVYKRNNVTRSKQSCRKMHSSAISFIKLYDDIWQYVKVCWRALCAKSQIGLKRQCRRGAKWFLTTSSTWRAFHSPLSNNTVGKPPIVINSVFDALSINNGLMAAVWLTINITAIQKNDG